MQILLQCTIFSAVSIVSAKIAEAAILQDARHTNRCFRAGLEGADVSVTLGQARIGE